MTLQAAVVLFLISMAGNIYQFWGNRKARDLDAIKNELELLQQLQKSKDKAYEEALRVKDLQIKQLTDEVKAQTELIEKNTNELKRMQKMVTFLIGNGCQDAATCADNCPYSLDDLDKILSGAQPQH
jgi:DNA mismatch repair ATPase MutS